MNIVVYVTNAELDEMDVTEDELKQSVIHDLSQKDEDYSGFDVDIVVTDD